MSVRLGLITYDCADAERMARFWGGLLEHDVDPGASPAFAMIGVIQRSSGPGWLFIAVPEGKVAKNRVHVDLFSPDREADVARAVGLGAARLGDFAEGGVRWTTLTDPEGNEFDIAAEVS